MPLSGPRRPLFVTPCHRQARRLVAVILWIPLAAPCEPRPDAVDGAATFEPVTVTARRVEEELLRVPVSVKVLPGELIDTTDLTSLYDLQFYAPGLVVTNNGMFGAGIALRGVSSQSVDSHTVAPYFDGVYLGASSLVLARMFDLERVEVVKGPQGTLYGSNATGGSINVISRLPEDHFSANLEGARGSFNTVRAQGYINLPADHFAVRVSVAASQGDGYIHNSVDDRKFGEQDYYGVRGALRARPRDRLTVDLTAQHVYDDGAAGELWLPRKDNLVDPNDIYLTTVTVPDPYLKASNDVGAANISYELDRAVLRSITGYARNETRDVDDCAGSPVLAGCVRGVHPDIYDQWSQEFHVESLPDSADPWLVGLYWRDASESRKSQLRAPVISSRPINDRSVNTDDAEYAVFGQSTRALAERWSVTGGARFSYVESRLKSWGAGIRDNPVPMAEQDSWTDWSWRLGLQFAPDDRNLVWASVATGFNSGGFTPEVLPNGQFDSYDPEDLTAYEVGVNLQLPDRRRTLSASAFLYDYDNLQVQTLTFVVDQQTSSIDNAASARIYGIDASTAIAIGDRWTMTGGVVWLPERKFVNFETEGTDLSGNTLIRAPEWSSSVSVGYRLPIGGVGYLSTRLDYNYRSKIYFTKENNPVESQGAFGLLNFVVRLEPTTEKWYLFAIARNVTDVDYFDKAYIQSNPGYPANQEIGFGVRF